MECGAECGTGTRAEGGGLCAVVRGSGRDGRDRGASERGARAADPESQGGSVTAGPERAEQSSSGFRVSALRDWARHARKKVLFHGMAWAQPRVKMRLVDGPSAQRAVISERTGVVLRLSLCRLCTCRRDCPQAMQASGHAVRWDIVCGCCIPFIFACPRDSAPTQTHAFVPDTASTIYTGPGKSLSQLSQSLLLGLSQQPAIAFSCAISHPITTSD